jgi:hypothetical protein
MATAMAKPAAASHPVLNCPHLMFPRPVSYFAVTRCRDAMKLSVSSSPLTFSAPELHHPKLTATRTFYGFASTSCCTARSSSISKSEYMS